MDLSFLFPQKIFSADTLNGPLVVTKSGSLIRVVVNGITQSVFDKDLEYKNGYWQGYIKNINFSPKNALILGYGAGTADHLLHHKFPKIIVVGVDNDPIIAQQVRKMVFPQLKPDVYINDAYLFLKKSKSKYDLIICDVFAGDKVDKLIFNDGFWKNIKRSLNLKGLIVVNRIFNSEEEINDFKYFLMKGFKITNTLKINSPIKKFNYLYYLKPI